MPWLFNPSKLDIAWVTPPDRLSDQAEINMGDINSDITLDTGERSNDSAIIDQGSRVVDGSSKPSNQGF